MKEIKFSLTGHKALWDWLSKNPSKDEFDWPGWKHNGGEYFSPLGFDCDYGAATNFNDEEGCYNCPFGNFGGNCRCLDGLWGKWHFESDPKKRSELAGKIRDLPVREGVECI